MTSKDAARGVNIENDGASELENFLTYKISILAKLVDRRSIHLLTQNFGLRLSEWRVLSQLANRSPSTVRALADRMKMDKADASRAAATLIEKKYVVRESDEADGRSANFYITLDGLEFYRMILPSRLQENATLSSFLTKEEGVVFQKAISKLTAQLSKES